ncbi:GNAT family N-acetyltransferase [Alicyclobacillus acidiphilus]|uniref:GNAT family N-acetyltransferase n=1 Tax=Alicyclobacillus acidiphilus TaxID=182455 RepID=UPI00083229CB|nr:GNAT family N-acetyltransferase [Alicyclobacillus acidiphilus]
MAMLRFDDAGDFLERCESFLAPRDPETNLILSNAYRMRSTLPVHQQPGYFGAVIDDDGGTVKMAAIMGYGLPLCVYGTDDVTAQMVRALVIDLGAWQREMRSVPVTASGSMAWPEVEIDPVRGRISKLVAPQELADLFADVWLHETGQALVKDMHMRLYRLTEVRDRGTAMGRLFRAQPEDVLSVGRFLHAMEAEALHGALTLETAMQAAERLVNEGRAFLWKVDGRAVSMACKTRPTQDGVVINCVYTPPTHRSRGYATACVAALSQTLLDEGYAFCSLFTDLENPTSNKIYMNIGYEPIRDYQEYNFPE